MKVNVEVGTQNEQDMERVKVWTKEKTRKDEVKLSKQGGFQLVEEIWGTREEGR